MNVIYSAVSNSILEYIKLSGQQANKPYLILRIHYYNILGHIDSIDILKELKVGDKIVSTSTRKSKTSSSATHPSKTKKARETKDIDLTTRHTKLGLMTPSAWNKLNADFRELIASKMLIMEQYCNSYKKITNTTPFFATGDKPANIATSSKEFPLDVGSGFLLHAGCDFITSAQTKFHNPASKKKVLNSQYHFQQYIKYFQIPNRYYE